VLVVLFGVLSGAFFGALAVTVRIGLRSGQSRTPGATIAPATAFLAAAALALGQGRASGRPAVAVPLLVGMLVPGASQILFSWRCGAPGRRGPRS